MANIFMTSHNDQSTKDSLTSHVNDTTKHITAAERTAWNAKANTTIATTTANGLMSAADKVKLNGVTTIPKGVIMMWSGATNNIPSGFVLCDGTNNTPDLRNRFIVAAGENYNIGDTGGQASASLAHAHSFSGKTEKPSKTISGGSGGIIVAANTHTHDFSGNTSSAALSVNTLPPYYALAYIMKS